MNNFKRLNLAAGWVSFAVAAVVYILTTEPTASFWDCSEFIATSYKLQVGHPPGAPLFMMIARFFTIFAPGPEHVALMVNVMSCLCGAFTILFLCWSITHLGRRIYTRGGQQMTPGQMWTVVGAGIIGSLAYCFTDTQWFSAVEAEVYSMSSMFTALVFWLMLRWEETADEPRSSRWLVLIAYLMGLSIGIHILNLLTIPALVFIYYFRKYPKVTSWGVVKTTLVAGTILLFINYLIIPYSVSVGAWMDKIFVNSFGLPVNSGMIFFVLLLFAAAALGIYVTHKRRKALANVIVLCVTFILIGYSSYASVVIRASTNIPMNSNDPSNPYSLLSLLNRDQYGDRPLVYGPTFASRPIDYTFRTMTYLGPDGRYHDTQVIGGYVYPEEMKVLFPRMYSSRADHVEAYKQWSHFEGRPVTFHNERVKIPTGGENLRYFMGYQLNFMYWRYFLWNFVGRQNDLQGSGDLARGNWLSGLYAIDNLYLGPQDNLPSDVAGNKARNTYYFLPFLLGLIGLIYQLGRDKRNFTVVMWLFVAMGIALVFYFNTAPNEPRERDYVYTGSFYAFSIWLGLGVMAVRDWLARISKRETVAVTALAAVLCSSVPIILAAQNWDDHDRSHRYVARDMGYNYLQSTLPGSIIINYGDNDTFPLWYNQEVEGVRLDVRVMNMSYLNGEWYINQMRRRSNDSPPVPFSLPESKYTHRNDYLEVIDRVEGVPVTLRELMEFIKREDIRSKDTSFGEPVDYVPAKQVVVPVNRENAIASGIVKPEDAHLIEDSIVITFQKNRIERAELMMLDMLDNFDWKIPIYFTQSSTLSNLGLTDYLQFDGFAYRLVPIRTPVPQRLYYKTGRIDTEYLYDKLMNSFRFGNIEDPRVYVDYFTHLNFNAAQTRNMFARLAESLLSEGDSVRAVEVLDAAMRKMPPSQLRHSYLQTIPLVEAYYGAAAMDKGDALLESYMNFLGEYIEYYLRFPASKVPLVRREEEEHLFSLYALYDIAEAYGREQFMEPLGEIFALYHHVRGGLAE